MSPASLTAAADAPWITPPALVLAGVSVANWILILAALYGAVRLAKVSIEFYWSWKDRKREEARQQRDDELAARGGGPGPDGSAQGSPNRND